MTLLTIHDVELQLQVSESTVRRLIARGELVSHRVGSSVRIDPADVDRYLRNH